MSSFIRRITQRGDPGSQTAPTDDRDLASERESWDTVVKRPIGRQSEVVSRYFSYYMPMQ